MIKIQDDLEKIKIEKEILQTLPRNNSRNINILYKKIEDMQYDVTQKNTLIYREIERRFNKLKKKLNNKENIDYECKIDELENELYYLNDIFTSYEKMGLDENIHSLKYYYMKDLNLVNINILECINKFKKVGIILSSDDFIYNKFVNEYMSTFFENIEELDTPIIKEIFEKVYWRCPEIITYIELNIRQIFFRYEKQIDKYYNEQKKQILRCASEILDECSVLKKHLMYNNILDISDIINSFLNGTISVKDYTRDKIVSDFSKFICPHVLENADDDKLEELNLEMLKFIDSLNEYKTYVKYKFLINRVNDVYKNKTKNKKEYYKIRKEILKKENKILKLNKKNIFKKKEDNILTKQTELALELKVLYKNLDKTKVDYKIESKISEKSNLFDLLYLASCFYDYMFDCIKENYKEMSEEEIKIMIDDIRNSVKNPCYNILTNIKVDENKNILYIIKDKYQLSNITIEEEAFDENNLDNLILSLKKYEIYYNIIKNKIDMNEVNDLCEFNRILQLER